MRFILLFLMCSQCGFVYAQDNASVQNVKTLKACLVTASKLIIRLEPSRESKSLSTIIQGHRVDVLQFTGKIEKIDNITGEWVRVVSLDGVVGYVFSGYLSDLEPVRDVVDHASIINDERCKESSIFLQKLSCIEKSEIAKQQRTISIDKDKIKIALRNGTIKIIERNLKNKYGDGDIKQYYVGYNSNIKSYIICVLAYESLKYLIINDGNGKSIDTWGLPIIRNDNKMFVSTASSYTGHGFNGVQIFSTDNESFEKIYESKGEWGATDVRWVSNDRVIFNRVSRVIDECFISTSELIYLNNKWHLVP